MGERRRCVGSEVVGLPGGTCVGARSLRWRDVRGLLFRLQRQELFKVQEVAAVRGPHWEDSGPSLRGASPLGAPRPLYS